ncbi:MAG: hypothetical protein KGI05_06990 [Thaumarchaeota archaeon]|nr:hypothetical protein [Nitrososphaerota archaeon]
MRYSAGRMEELLANEGIITMPDGSCENSGKDFHFEKFPCYGCLRKYKYWWMSRLCRKIHMIFTPNKIPAQMVR